MLMGSGAEAAEETVDASAGARRKGRRAEGAPVPAVRGRDASSRRCPRTVKSIAVLDRTKEPGAVGEPLYLDVRDGVRGANAACGAR